MNSKTKILRKTKIVLIFALVSGFILTIFSFPILANEINSYNEITLESQNLDSNIQTDQLQNETYPVLNKNNNSNNYSEKLYTLHPTNNNSSNSEIFRRNNSNGLIYEDDRYIYVKDENGVTQIFYKNNLTFKKEINNKSNSNIIRKVNHNNSFPSVDDFDVKISGNRLYLKPNNLDENIVSCYWDFGDGAYEIGSDVSHEYKKPGIYEVTLTVNYENGESTTFSKKVNVQGSSNNNFLFAGKQMIIIAASAFFVIILICKYSLKSSNKSKKGVSRKDENESDFVWKPSINDRVFDKNEEFFDGKNKRFFYFRVF